jgi:hypothetical protein
VRLLGTVPVAVAPNETAIAAGSVLDKYESFHALRAASAISLVSAGLVVKQPIDIVETTAWRLALERGRTYLAARVVDAEGRRFDGITSCEQTTYRDGRSSTSSTCIANRVDRYDRVCFAVHGQTACEDHLTRARP